MPQKAEAKNTDTQLDAPGAITELVGYLNPRSGFDGEGFGVSKYDRFAVGAGLTSEATLEHQDVGVRIIGCEVSGRICNLVSTHRLHSSSFLGLPCRVLNMNPKKELLWSL